MKSAPEPPLSEALLSMRGISKSYGERKILDRIDLDVAPREKVAVIGPSGSGKTTILRAAIGLVKPDEGTIRIDGAYLWHEQTPHGLRPAGERHARKVRRAVGIVFQQFNLFPHMTALENVREPLVHALGLPRRESDARARDLLGQVGLKDHLGKHPAQLSGGQQQRVAIARSLALQPKRRQDRRGRPAVAGPQEPGQPADTAVPARGAGAVGREGHPRHAGDVLRTPGNQIQP